MINPPQERGSAANCPTNTRRSSLLYPVLALTVYVLLGLVALDAAPRSFGDEAWYAGFTVGLRQNGVPHHPVIQGRGGIDHYYLQPKLLLNYLAVPITWVLGDTLFAYRLVTWLVGAGGLAATFLLADSLGGRRVGWCAALWTASSFWFFMCARTFRPEILVLTFNTLYAYLLIRSYLLRGWLPAVMAGACAALALQSHQISLFFLTAITIAVVLTADTKGRFRSLLLVAAACLVFLSPYLVYILVKGFGRDASLVVQLTGEGQGFQWSISSVFQKEIQRWKNLLNWPLGLFTLFLWTAALVHGLASRKRPNVLLATVILLGVAGLLWVPLLTGRYAVTLIPFFCTLAAILLDDVCTGLGFPPGRDVGALTQQARSGREPGRWFPASGAVPAILILAIAGYFLVPIIAVYYSHRGASYSRLKSELRCLAGDAHSVSGPIAFYLAFPDRRFVPANTPPEFTIFDADHRRWLRRTLDAQEVEVVFETTTRLQATQGLGPRPRQFDRFLYSRVLREVLDSGWQQTAEVDTRDFGPIRVWRRVAGGTGDP